MKTQLSNGSTISFEPRPGAGEFAVILDNPNAPADMRDLEAGRVIDGAFQSAPLAAFALRPDTLRAIADFIERTS